MLNRYLSLFIFISAFITTPLLLSAQDSIRSADIQKFSFPFDIVDGELVGQGAEVLTEAVANSHIVMLGNNTRNQMESDLDHALTTVLNTNDYKNMIMEIGPLAATVVNDLTNDPSKLVGELKKLNQQYYYEAGELLIMPIPDLKYLGTGELVTSLKEKDWSLGGIGVESWTSYKMIIDKLYQGMPRAFQIKHNADLKTTSALFDKLYGEMQGQSYDDLANLIGGLRSSAALNSLLAAFKTFDVNEDALESLHFSLDYWEMYSNKQGYEKNRLSSKRNKTILKKELEKMNFDFVNDKLLVKMWRGHLTNGVTPNNFYGVGNMLMELAAYHGHKSLNIGIFGRYMSDGDKVIDAMGQDGGVRPIHQPFVAQGQKEQWVLVDLRPFTETFYWGDYIKTKEMLYMMRSYDMIIIPKTDLKAKVNH